ncbi:MAG: hypothetical protein SF172_18145 [Burkholderiales bacterium]|nr:hypothetical protein [Burkholderiales bacterium]
MIPVDLRARSASQQLARHQAMSESELRKALLVARGTLARLKLRQDLADLRSTSARAIRIAQTGARASALAWAIAAAAVAWRRVGRGPGSRPSRWLDVLGIAAPFLLRLARPSGLSRNVPAVGAPPRAVDAPPAPLSRR